MKTMIFGAGSDLGVHIDGAHLGPVQLMNDIQSFYKGESVQLIQDESIIKSRNLSEKNLIPFYITKWLKKFLKSIFLY